MRKKLEIKELWSNIKYIVKEQVRQDWLMILCSILHIPTAIISPLIMALVPKVLIDKYNQGAAIEEVILIVGFLTLGMLVLLLAEKFLRLYIEDAFYKNLFRYRVNLFEKMMCIRYEDLISEKQKNLREKAEIAVRGMEACNFFNAFISLVTSLIGIITYIGILALVYPGILVVLIAINLISLKLSRVLNQYVISKREERAAINKELRYLYEKTSESEVIKEIITFNLKRWISQKGKKAWQKSDKIKEGIIKYAIRLEIINAFVLFGKDIFIYAVLIMQVIQGNIDVSDFIVYFSVVVAFSTFLAEFFSSFSNLEVANMDVSDYRKFMELPQDQYNSSEQGTEFVLEEEKAFGLDIEFRNVSYSYSETGRKVLDNVNFKINAGEKLALVGLNGAGKTTIVKLLCGLIRPTEGQVLVGGRNIESIDQADYYNLITVVFQDLRLLPLSIEANIALKVEEEIDNQKVKECIEKAGLTEKIGELPKKEKTMLIKRVNEEAEDLSGGETQKLLLARALYKTAPILILDEPTSALDPIAEKRLYQQYLLYAEQKTSLFVSHRLVSTQFCDRILLLQDGQIVEQGSHQELLEKQGEYAKLYKAQSKYYRKEVPIG